MKDPSRPRCTSPSNNRSVPYRKRKPSALVSPARPTRRANDASRQMPASDAPDRAQNPQRGETQPVCAPDGERRPSLSKAGGNHALARKNTHSDGPKREQPTHAAALSIHATPRGPSLRLPLSSAPPSTTAFASQRKTNRSPSPESVNTFLRSIELPDKPVSAPPLAQTSFPLSPPSLRLPPLSTQRTNVPSSRTNGNGYQVSLVYKGYPFTYDLSTLPDDPKSMIALLTLTKSDPGPYLLVGAHYRRTGRSSAACAVIRSLLDNLDCPSDAEKSMVDVTPITPVSSDASKSSSEMLLYPPDSQCPPKPVIDRTVQPGIKGAAIRPAMLLLAACEMDISREHPDHPESASHVSTAHNLFRAIYGTVNDAIVAGAVRPQQSKSNTLGLDFPPSQDVNRSSSDIANGRRPPLPNGGTSSPAPRREMANPGSSARVKHLEKELSASRVAQKKLQERLSVSNDHLTRAEGKLHVLEMRSRNMLVQLDASRDENWELRHRLAESEERARELTQRQVPNADSRVRGRLKDLLFDNLGDGVRNE